MHTAYSNAILFSRISVITNADVCVRLTQLSVPALSNLYGHGAGHDVSGGQVFGVGCVALHEALSLTVNQDPALATATLCDQAASPIDSYRDVHVKMKSTLWLNSCVAADAT